MKTFLHVGCGPKHKGQTTRRFNTPNWTELRLDIDQSVKPDLWALGTVQPMGEAGLRQLAGSHFP